MQCRERATGLRVLPACAGSVFCGDGGDPHLELPSLALIGLHEANPVAFPSVVLFPPSACSLSHDLAMPSVSDFEQTMVLVACGPYTTSDSITYDPLLDLIAIINHDRPDVCILVGSCAQ